MIAVVDYGVGNLFSLRSSFAMIGAEAEVTGDPDRLRAADRIILPGVGAFADAAARLRAAGLDAVLREEAAGGKYILGICLGMQMLFDVSREFGVHPGLGLIPGDVVPMAGRIPPELKIPHIGWNGLIFKREHPLFRYVREGDAVYFVHSYFADRCDDFVLATAEYGAELTAAVGRDNVLGCQFHPEKSGEVGLNILRAFCEMR
ncbi:MAG: imidazole glycerol phosphate synthase subunit HisH [Oscillospiraceae bacterium]|nr:imidazole glycerol phosphate synthase subunit HisH [Oscillospiraceae bacterium]